MCVIIKEPTGRLRLQKKKKKHSACTNSDFSNRE